MKTAAVVLLFARGAFGQTPDAPGPSLLETLRAAAAASPEVLAATRRRDEAALEEPLLLANLDPKAIASYAAIDDRRPRAVPAFEGSRARIDRWEAGLTQTTLLGTEAKLAFQSERLVNATAFRPLNPTVDSRLTFEFKQRLARYFWGRPDRARRARARSGVAAAQAALERTLSDALLRAARAHVELAYADALVAIRERGVEDAKRLLEKYEERRRFGLAENSDVLQAKASLELQEIEAMVARSLAERARVSLGAAVFSSSTPRGLRAGPVDFIPSRSALAVGEAEAMSRVPELMIARHRAESLRWSARLARLDTLPDLSLDASYSFAGLETGYRRSWSDMSTWRHPVSMVGMSVVFPLGFRHETLTRRQADLQLAQAEAEVASIEASARRRWRDVGEQLSLSSARVAAARRLFELEKRKYDSGLEDFKRGRASTDLLVRFQQDIRRAEADLLRAQTDERTALFEAADASGQLTRTP
ncbi:MAG: TolC family protein [Elusimicrobiota bacterium]